MNSIGTHRSFVPMHSLSATHAWHVATDARGVVVHVFVAGSQLFAPQADSSLAVHSTHVPVSQTPVPVRCAQSGFVVQGPQLCAAPHTAAAGSVQSVAPTHATHVFPAGSQRDSVPLQSPSSRHATHSSVGVVRQCEVVPLQTPSHGT